ncbi:DUF4291 domain-containing protein [Aquimarina pacifica]|uniref:DUF4291 domain-containing protein n=1 Tax=Aquimarina pacifica TaxID=1296415 RepID=UPI0004700478|nr:DUF4291 domain-containing protein [Aquimarina pacifica]
MKLQLEKYIEQKKEWPHEGYHIMAQYNEEKIVVYQSYRPAIGHFAAKNQYFGGAFSLDRMSWIKPNFLWMMFRNGWGTKVGQEVVLAIHLKRKAFESYLQNAVYSSFRPELYDSYDAWQADVQRSNVRLQWDPDHNPNGGKLQRRAIQIGLRKEYIASYAKDDIIEIEDISEFVKEQYEFVTSNTLENLMTPKEKPLVFDDEKLNQYLMLE